MQEFRLVLIGIFVALLVSCQSQTAHPELSINTPTIEQEATSIWRTINDIAFFENQGYKINLPENELINTLILRSKNGSFGNEDYPAIYQLLETTVYKKENYDSALKKVKAQEALLDSLLQQLHQYAQSWDWSFKIFESYELVFTLYGTGGSYNPDEGTITLFTTPKGEFMNYENPANTIIHEIVHIGIEASIVKASQLPHGLKERVVDTMVYLLFKTQLPTYKIQNMGDRAIDEYLQKKKDIDRLPEALKKLATAK